MLIEQDENGIFVASVSDLTGCHTQAKSLKELFSRISVAIELVLEVQKLDDEVNASIRPHS